MNSKFEGIAKTVAVLHQVTALIQTQGLPRTPRTDAKQMLGELQAHLLMDLQHEMHALGPTPQL